MINTASTKEIMLQMNLSKIKHLWYALFSCSIFLMLRDSEAIQVNLRTIIRKIQVIKDLEEIYHQGKKSIL